MPHKAAFHQGSTVCQGKIKLSSGNSTTVKLLTEQHMELPSLKRGLQACLSLFRSKCHIVGNLMSQLKTFCINMYGIILQNKKG